VSDDNAHADLVRSLLTAIDAPLPDTEHALRCAAFADAIFRDAHEVLGLHDEHRQLAVAAALLHDIGYLRGDKDHHRKSFDVIRLLRLPGFTESEQVIVACAARYHGRSSPNIEHAGFGEMSFEEQRVVRRIAAITRLSTALDASHLGLVSGVDVRPSGNALRLTAYARQEPAVERDRLRESAGGFTALTQIPMRVEIVIENTDVSASSTGRS
jgi:exopolyphosphatase / guanosine-5'-triphosphate,3'-diphosphate pyrophosphatase